MNKTVGFRDIVSQPLESRCYS